MTNKIIPYGKQDINEDDINAVVEALKSDFLTQGPTIATFEEAFAKYVGSEYAVAVSNGTAALHLCAMALNVKSGDKVITSPMTFAASANCVKYCGGEVVFADIDPETYLININQIKALLEDSPRGTYKGLIPVDFAGRAVDMAAMRRLANDHDLWIIEDACHAPGGFYLDNLQNKHYCGSSKFADLAIFSFHPVKHIAAGEGGMITTNDEALYNKLVALRTHGIVRDKSIFRNDAHLATGGADEEYPGWYMEMQDLGYNYRLTDIQAALAISQLSRAKEGIERRREIAVEYFKAFENMPWLRSQSGIVEGHAYHLYIIEVDRRLELYKHLRECNIFAQIHYIPVHLMPYYRDLGWNQGDMPNAESYYKGCLSLPMFPTLSNDDQKLIIDTVLSFYSE